MNALPELMDDVAAYMQSVGEVARAASRAVAASPTAQRNDALLAMADRIVASADTLKAANALDLEAGRANGLDAALLDRLALTDERIEGMAEGLRQIATLPDPVGQMSDMNYRPSGIQVGRMRVPLGVIGIIYESRPNVTADAAGLCLKSGNACILRGGSEAIHSNRAIADCIRAGLAEAGLPEAAVQVIETTDRAAVGELLKMEDFVDVIVPRGGKGLIERVSRESRVPVIKHLDGICHVYIDADADAGKALDIALNAKTHRYGVCNAMETLLVDIRVAPLVLPEYLEAFREFGTELRGCERTRSYIDIAEATEEDFDTEYLDNILSIKVVDGVDDAIAHIARYGSGHSESIVTENYTTGEKFLNAIDAACVYINASTQFTDGGEFGFGAEVGISTNKLHARGPMGINDLTTYKYKIYGNGQTRA